MPKITEEDARRMANNIENQVGAVYRANRNGELTLEALSTAYLPLKSSMTLLKKLVESYEKPIKATLDTEDKVVIGDREFYFKVSQSRNFDTDKAKALIESLDDYSVEDFIKLTPKRTLLSETIIN